MPNSGPSRTKWLVFIFAVMLFAGFALPARPIRSLPFLTPIDICDDSQTACPRGGEKTFGPFRISFPNGFYTDIVRVYCNLDSPTVLARPIGLHPVGQPVSCYFGQTDDKPITKFLQPIRVTMQIPSGQSSQVAMYMYQPTEWTKLPSTVSANQRMITFSLEQLNPIEPNKLNYFWLFESQSLTAVPRASPSPRVPLMSSLTSTPTSSSKPTTTPGPTRKPELTATATVRVASNPPTATPMPQSIPGGPCGGAAMVVGLVAVAVMTRRARWD